MVLGANGVSLANMKQTAMALVMAALLGTGAQAAPKVVGEWPKEIKALACTNGEGIYILEGAGEDEVTPLVMGDNPAISPTGGQLAYTHTDAAPADGAPERTVRIITDHGAGQPLNPFPKHTNFDPMWSPDGRYVAMNVLGADNNTMNWAVWSYEIQTGKTQLTTKTVPSAIGVFLCSWSGPKTLLAHDLSNLYEVGADGASIATLPLEPLIGDLAIDSGTRFVLTPDRRYLYFSAPDSVEDNAPVYVYKTALKAGQPIKVCEGTDFQIIGDGVLLVAITHNDSPSIAIHREHDKTTAPLVEFAWAPTAVLSTK